MIKFIEEEPILILEPEYEKDILNILEEDEWYSIEESKKLLRAKRMNKINYYKQAKSLWNPMIEYSHIGENNIYF